MPWRWTSFNVPNLVGMDLVAIPLHSFREKRSTKSYSFIRSFNLDFSGKISAVSEFR